MIVGNGLLANTFRSYEKASDVLIFASGVSNSSETNTEKFGREQFLLESYSNFSGTCVYFSSCDTIYAERLKKPYYYHKLAMESLVERLFKKHVIFRIPQVIGVSKNSNSLLNYFVNAILLDREIEVHEYAYKNLIAVEDVKNMADVVLSLNKPPSGIYNLINKRYYSVKFIIEALERVLNKKAKLKFLPIGFEPEYEWNPIFDEVSTNFGDDYLHKSLTNCYKSM